MMRLDKAVLSRPIKKMPQLLLLIPTLPRTVTEGHNGEGGSFLLIIPLQRTTDQCPTAMMRPTSSSLPRQNLLVDTTRHSPDGGSLGSQTGRSVRPASPEVLDGLIGGKESNIRSDLLGQLGLRSRKGHLRVSGQFCWSPGRLKS
ncbi:hypothetical protein AAWM_04715 [Aspergillus awamori]|uniref:Uncharacterized protein n=1 Tax=Aspergillus awamori TaxID=105351 RepID=A0A401KRC6_ASPAW|nr:hypothetical protein AAWM_04715 [Aspergillus awamori]